jgi:hypothetical protein
MHAALAAEGRQRPPKKKAPRKNRGASEKPKNPLSYAFFLAFNAFKASVKRDLYRFAVFSESVRFRIALSKSENVTGASFSAAPASPDVKAARIRRIDDRTRVRFIRFTAARRSVWRIFFNTDFVFFLCFTAAPCAIPYSFVVYFRIIENIRPAPSCQFRGRRAAHAGSAISMRMPA